ncbi:MAG TPA: DUF6064 family protein [Ramlibacter sp.]|uniref:DUF6064 family protein n=1 Tax=Ramlibacter sp. TaxID=1917967 RepID=UPI002D7EA8C0|nr:DUF6064 family protein [Ramlibacter sp.]HET8747731.1 DUF6064 family protein [Ramlibacter sp.]
MTVTEWWTYGLSDFLMFSPQVYWRLVARHNAAWWPWQALALAAALALPVLLRARRPGAQRAALAVAALAWAWLGWAFHWRLYSEIFLAAPSVALACGLQALLLAAAAGLPLRSREGAAPGPLGAILLAAALLYPLLAPLTGHPWSEAEVFGFMPEPTALATLGVLAGVRAWPAWSRWLLSVIPGASLLLGAATRWLIAQ